VIAAEHEQVQGGDGPGFLDSVAIDFCDGKRDLFGHLRLTRLPESGRASALALLFSRGEVAARQVVHVERNLDSWERAELEGSWITTEAPLARWKAGFVDQAAGFELEAQASSAPIELGNEATAGAARTAGLHRYEQLCEVQGKATVRGRELALRCRGRRQHFWGAYDWERLERWRSLYAVGNGDAGVTVVSARPAGSAGHGDELQGAFLVTGFDKPVPFEEVRISTVFTSDHLPGKAGVELFMEGDEYPSRVSGEALCGTSVELGEEAVSLSFFRWSIDGREALGAYESVHRK
jgi:hypothetical protein